jgi:hypothetical protein
MSGSETTRRFSDTLAVLEGERDRETIRRLVAEASEIGNIVSPHTFPGPEGPAPSGKPIEEPSPTSRPPSAMSSSARAGPPWSGRRPRQSRRSALYGCRHRHHGNGGCEDSLHLGPLRSQRFRPSDRARRSRSLTHATWSEGRWVKDGNGNWSWRFGRATPSSRSRSRFTVPS